MSSRNTGLFVPGHIDENSLNDLSVEGIRIGHGVRKRKKYTHVGIPVLEESGCSLFDSTQDPHAEDLVHRIIQELSTIHGKAILLFCDDERGAGGHVLFEKGQLTARDVVDGRGYTPVRRDLQNENILENLDSSDWVWPLIADALESGSKSFVGVGIQDDDDIEALIIEAGSLAPEDYTPPGRSSSTSAQSQVRGRGERVGRLLSGLRKRLKR